jgi:hypothetical protein
VLSISQLASSLILDNRFFHKIVGAIQNHYVSVLEQSEACKDEIEGYGVFFARSDVRAPMTRTPYHSINVFWDTYRQYTPTRLLFQSRTSLFKVTNPRAYCVCRRNLTAGRNLIVNFKFSRFSAPPCTTRLLYRS